MKQTARQLINLLLPATLTERNDRLLRRCLSIAAMLVIVALFRTVNSQDDRRTPENGAAPKTLVEVNGHPITDGDLSFLMLAHQVPDELQPSVRKRFLDELIDKRLLQAYLESRKAKPDAGQLDLQVNRVMKIIRRSGDDPQKVLQAWGYNAQTLRRELALPLAWNSHFRLILTDSQIRRYWMQHRQQFDGTRVRASHVVIKADDDTPAEALAAIEAKLGQLRGEIVAGKTTFAEAAKQHSQGPSRDQGGDLGLFPFRGKMPVALSTVAFSLEVGQVSDPFRSPFGIHLMTLTERKPGELSLEDARPQVLDALSRSVRRELVQRERAKADIKWKVIKE